MQNRIPDKFGQSKHIASAIHAMPSGKHKSKIISHFMQTTSKIQQKGHNDYDNEVITKFFFLSRCSIRCVGLAINIGGCAVGPGHCCVHPQRNSRFQRLFFINFILNDFEYEQKKSPHLSTQKREHVPVVGWIRVPST